MPGSIITSVLNAPYLSAVWNGTATKSGDVLTFTTAHGLQTGDIVYTAFGGGDALRQMYGYWGVFVIVLSSTSISLASSLADASNNVVLSLSTFPNGSQAFSNIPFTRPIAFYGGIPLSAWQSRATSAQVFSLNTPVAISGITHTMIGASDQNQPYYIGLKTATDSYYCGFGLMNQNNSSLHTSGLGDTISGFSSFTGFTNTGFPAAFRFTITSAKRITIEALSNGTTGSWVTRFTSSILTTQDPLFFFCNSALNNISITDCQVTYL